MDKKEEYSVIYGYLQKLLTRIEKTSWKKLLKIFISSLFIILTVSFGIFCYNMVTNQKSVDSVIEMYKQDHDNDVKLQKIRDCVTPTIRKIMQQYIIEDSCQRLMVFEVHNGKKNPTGMPFKYFDMTYEEIDELSSPVYYGDIYQNQSTTLYSIADKADKAGYWSGSITDFKDVIDNRFFQKMKIKDNPYIGVVTMYTDDHIPVGFIVQVSKERPNKANLLKLSRHIASLIVIKK